MTVSLILAITISLPMSVAAQESPVSPEIMIPVQPLQSSAYVAQPPQEAMTGAEIISVVVTPTPVATPEPTSKADLVEKPIALANTGSHADWMAAAGIPSSDWANVDFIVSRESGWRVTVQNPLSPAYGLCQSLPASKMATAGSDYLTNPVTQLRWCHHYALERYRGWAGAVSWWQTHHWW